MKVSRSISHRVQYTALVDILFATIGIFVIVFALQDLDPQEVLQPAPYDHLILCDTVGRLDYTGPDSDAPVVLDTGAVTNGELSALLSGGGRVLVALSSTCLGHEGGGSIARQLRDLEDELSARPPTETTPLTLFEFAPLGNDEAEAETLRQRFASGRAS